MSLRRSPRKGVGAGRRVRGPSSLTRTCRIYLTEVYAAMFAITLEVCRNEKFVKRDRITAGADSTLLEANAAMNATARPAPHRTAKPEKGDPTSTDAMT